MSASTIRWGEPWGPHCYDFTKFIVVREGSALTRSGSDEGFANVGDVLLLSANMPLEVHPEECAVVTVIALDTDYLLDQLFWQHAPLLIDRLSARTLADTLYAEPVQLLRVGEACTLRLEPWLDELVALSAAENYFERFHRVQTLWFSIIDQIAPFVRATPARIEQVGRSWVRPAGQRDRPLLPLRAEARQVWELLRANLRRSWLLPELAAEVHISVRQLTRVFIDAYGKTPLAYQTMLRVEAMAALLRETDLTVIEIARMVGWESRNRATKAFREAVGITPSQYRAMHAAEDTE